MKKKDFKRIAEQDYLDLTVEVRDNKTGDLVDTKTIRTRSNIFQPNKCNSSKIVDGKEYEPTNRLMLRVRGWLRWCNDLTYPYYRRWWFIHLFVKKRLLYPSFKFLEWLLKRYIVTSDDQIHKSWYNNHIRIFNHCWHSAVDDIYRVLIWNQEKMKCKVIGKPFTDTPDEFINKHCKHQSVRWRKLMCDLLVTEMLEDTADREWCNFFVLRVCHELMSLYGLDVDQRKRVPVPGEYPVYLSKTPYYPDYFSQNVMRDKWLHPDEREKLIKRLKKSSKSGMVKTKTRRMSKDGV